MAFVSTKLVPQDHLTSTFRKTNRIKSIVIPDDAAEIRYPDPFFPWIPDIPCIRTLHAAPLYIRADTWVRPYEIMIEGMGRASDS